MAATSRADWQRAALVVVLSSLAASMVSLPVPALAQDSRRGEIAQRQAEKARQLRAHVENRGEKIMDVAERVLEGNPSGVYPWVGSVLGGGWMAFGAGYTQPYADTGRYNVLAGWSLRNYKLLQANLRLPEFADRTVRVDLNAKWIDAPRVSWAIVWATGLF